MSFSILVLGLSVLAITQQADAGCLFKPPFKCRYTSIPSIIYKYGSQSALPAPQALPKYSRLPPAGPPKFDFLPPSVLPKFSLPPPSALFKFGLPSLPNFPPCPKPSATKVTNKPDVTIPLPLPAEIPVGKFCTCQKFSVEPTVVPCVPTPALVAPPVAAPAPLPTDAPLTLTPELLNAILAGVTPAYAYGAAAAAAPPTQCTCV